MSLPSLLDDHGAATILGINFRTLQRWRRRGCGPKYLRLGGKLVRYRETDLTAFLDANARTSTREEAATRTGCGK